ncbi:MAG: hypothetical protein ACOYVJ_01915, partial [Nitrospirota bacterium]
VNYGFGDAMANHGVLAFAETDKHYFHPMRYRSGVGALLRAITVITAKEPTSALQIGGEWFVKGMLNRDGFEMKPVVFCERVVKKNEVRLGIIPERSNTFMENVDDFFASIRQGAAGAWHIAKELIKAGWKKVF